MNSLIELWNAAMAPVNIAFTILLGLVILYWIVVSIGFLDLEALDFDFDGDGEVDGSFLRFLNAGEIPAMLVISILLLCFWSSSVAGNYYLNPGNSWLIAVAMWLPFLFLSMLLTRWITAPMRKLFRALGKQSDAAAVKMIGLVCEVTSSTVDENFGTAIAETGAAPLLLNIRAEQSEKLSKGDRAMIITESPEKRIFKVIRYQQPE